VCWGVQGSFSPKLPISFYLKGKEIRDDELEVGTAIGRYNNQNARTGQHGGVMKQRSQSGQSAALKILRLDYAGSESLLARLSAKSWFAAVEPSRILFSLLDFGEHEGKSYFVMSLIRGITLMTWLRSRFFCPLEVLTILERFAAHWITRTLECPPSRYQAEQCPNGHD